jgi:hypothetical protein
MSDSGGGRRGIIHQPVALDFCEAAGDQRRGLLRTAGSGSQILTCQLERAKTLAQARPISPDPTMATTGIAFS